MNAWIEKERFSKRIPIRQSQNLESKSLALNTMIYIIGFLKSNGTNGTNINPTADRRRRKSCGKEFANMEIEMYVIKFTLTNGLSHYGHSDYIAFETEELANIWIEYDSIK